MNFVAAESVVNAAGPWAGELRGVPPEVRIPITPVKGQLLTLTMPRRLVTRALSVPGAYLIPRTDGTLVIGETVDETGFDVSIDPAATQRLHDAAVRAMPALADARDRSEHGPACDRARPTAGRSSGPPRSKATTLRQDTIATPSYWLPRRHWPSRT